MGTMLVFIVLERTEKVALLLEPYLRTTGEAVRLWNLRLKEAGLTTRMTLALHPTHPIGNRQLIKEIMQFTARIAQAATPRQRTKRSSKGRFNGETTQDVTR